MSLKGKVILLDPGHGGEELGAVGQGGLLEKEVNLSVALFLREMLENMGAVVKMTRETDETVPRHQRKRMADEMNPDAFVSIHHNAMPEDFTNRVEVYYPWVEQGPSFDLAWLIAARLSKAMNLPHAKPLPSKYTVMQTRVEPAVLTEASYIADPKEEVFLRSEKRRKAEAKAIADAIAHYFEIPNPKIESVDVIRGRIDVKVQGDIEPFYSVVRVDDEYPIFEVSAQGLSVYMPFLSNGEHTVECVVRNHWGRSSPLVRKKFAVKRGPASFAVSVFPPIVPYRTEAPILLSMEALDHYGMPVADGTKLDVEILEASGKTIRERFEVQRGRVLYRWLTSTTSARIKLSSGRAQRVIPVQVRRDSRYSMFFAAINPPGKNVRVRYKEHSFPALDGRFFWISGYGGISGDIEVWSLGYKPQILSIDLSPGESVYRDIEMQPIKGGLLLDRRFYIDIGDPRLMPVATELRNLLHFHGAEVMTSQDTQVSWIPEEHSAWNAQAFGCEVLISLDTADTRLIKYYYLNAQGRALAEIIKGSLQQGIGLEFEMVESGQYILIHPDGARVAVHMPSDRGFSGVAQAIFEGILNYAVIEFSG